MDLLVTAGPTREHLDEVRFLSNLSSGRMGYAVARAGAAAGHRVTLVSGPTALEAPDGVRRLEVESAAEMHREVRKAWPSCRALVMAAAVADWRPALRQPGKMKKDGLRTATLELVRTPDILAELGPEKAGRIVVGFALETEGLLAEAARKLAAKNLDAIVANSLENLGGDSASATLIEASGAGETWTGLPKDEIGRRLVALVERLAAAKAAS